MLRNFILFIYLVLPAAAFAQMNVAADSLYTYRQTINAISAAKMGATLLQGSNIQKVSQAGIHYRNSGGSFRVAQEAQQTKSGQVYTEGITTLNRFKLYGYFSFARIMDDSLAFNMKGIKDSPQPTYFMAGKASNYERQNFTGGGIISYELFKDRLFISTGVDYLYNSTAGSVDPRALVYTYQLKFRPELSYKIGNQIIGLGALAGYGDQDVEQIRYKNGDYNGSLTYPLRISNLNYGFGYYEASISPFVRKNTYTGLSLSYSKQGTALDYKARISYEIDQEDNQYEPSNSIVNNPISSFQLESLGFDLLITKSAKGNSQQLKMHLLRQIGDDKLVAQAARNYTYKNYDGQLQYSYLNTKNSRHQGEWIAGFLYHYGYKRDAASSHLLDYTTYEPLIGHTHYWTPENKDLISAGLQLSARLPFDTQVNIPATQVTLFSKGVVFPDYLYWSAKAARASFRFNYVTERIIKKFRTGFGIESSYLRAVNTVADFNNATFIPEKGYLDLKLSLNLYL